MNQPNLSEETLFEMLSQLPAEQRAAQLLAGCGEDAAMRKRLEKLLAVHDRAGEFMAEPADPALRREGGFQIPVAERLGDRIGPYKLVQRIGAGGCGVVYMAQQEKPMRRLVALKVIKLGMDTRQVVARFEAERQALALMDHPNIAKVLDAGATDTGRPFFVMELVRGIKITDYCDQNQLATRERLELFAQVCRAVQHAHQKGIIHRDLKPSNILVTVNDGIVVPKIIDFGIAKATQERLTDKTLVTAFEQIIGTPAYMSPEQAEMTSLDIDTRSDIYSLGVLLYELLTGKTPLDTQRLLAAGWEQMRQTIREQQPLRPSTRLNAMGEADRTIVAKARRVEAAKLSGLLRGDLDWVVMKCLEKDRARRYDTASGLAREIERHLSNEPVSARPPSQLYEFQRLVRRHRAGFAAAAAVLLALSAGALISALEAKRARAAEHVGQRLLYAATMNLVQAAWEQNHLDRVRQLLEQTSTDPERGFEWYYWQQQLHLEQAAFRGHLAGVSAIAFSPDSRRLATGSDDGTVKIWDAQTGQELLSLNGPPVSGEPPIRFISGHYKGVSSVHGKAIFSVAFSPDGRRIAAGSVDATAKVWDAMTGQELLVLKGHKATVLSVAFSPDGRRIVTGSDDKTAKLWDAASGTEIYTFRGHGDSVNSVAFSADGTRIATGSDDKTAKLWDAASRTEIYTFQGHGASVFSVAFSADGKRLLTASDDATAKVWDTASGKELVALKGHTDSVLSAAFLPGDSRIVTGSADKMMKVWDAATGNELFTIRGHEAAVQSVACSADGRWLASGSDDQTAKLWDAATQPGITVLVQSNASFSDRALAFSPDSQRVLTGTFDGLATLWDATTGKRLLRFKGHTGPVRSVAFFPDGQRAVTGSGDQTARVWDCATGQELLRLKGHSGAVISVAVSRDSQHIVSGSADGTAKLWDAATGTEVFTLTEAESVLAVAFSPDGQRIATGSADFTVKIWNVTEGKQLVVLYGHSNWVEGLAFSPDGRQIATGSDDGTARLWDATSGRPMLVLSGHSLNVRSTAFSPDGRRILTGSGDGTARLWDVSNGKELLTLKGCGADAAFSPNGSRIALSSAEQDQVARLSQAASEKSIALWRDESKAAAMRLEELKRRQVADQQQQERLSDETGAIKQWLLIAPIFFEGSDGARALAQQQIQNESSLSPRPWDRTETCLGERRWRPVQLSDYRMDICQLIKGNPSSCVAYAVSYIQSEMEQPALMKVGSDDEAKVYLNGEMVYQYQQSRPYLADQDSAPVRLQKGLNVIVFKVVNEVDYWQGSIHLTDLQGRPLQHIRATITPALPQAPGAVSDWLLLAPITLRGRDGAKALAEKQLSDEATLTPRAGQKQRVGSAELMWREIHLDDYGLDFAALVGQPKAKWRVAYAVCYIDSDRPQTGLCLRVGSDDQSKIYLNGKEVYRCSQFRPFSPDLDPVPGIDLKAGINVLVFKVVNQLADWRGSVRFTDAQRQPVKGMRLRTDPGRGPG